MARFYSADPHYGHQNVILYCQRPFKTLDEMHFELVKRWNAVVRPEDEAWILGDFSLRFEFVENFLPLLQGQIHLVDGNHDKCHPASTRKNPGKAQKMREAYLKAGFKSIQEKTTHRIGKHEVTLHHFPFKGAGDPQSRTYQERYTEHRPEDKGQWLLHGHVHHHWLRKGRCINVGVDVWNFTPVQDTEIEKIINGALPYEVKRAPSVHPAHEPSL